MKTKKRTELVPILRGSNKEKSPHYVGFFLYIIRQDSTTFDPPFSIRIETDILKEN
ncbi:hypothetical protein JCM21714_4275 [Gracilibacillus boraciitolerans JCM 21714]|uniref:Uncharacterized protein n=1 Tax=Gracilibacillus boraciitolerans JCM 21714 TaxID=1298598 RepID=W4VPD7_9BACI|nr:hypothetical protein JCM21714_4275 [Gracilibacillus boraciitolerans JCM 21714]